MNNGFCKTARRRLRENPEYFFGCNDITGVQNAFKGLLDIFSVECLSGYGKEISVKLNSDSSVSISMMSERPLLAENKTDLSELTDKFTQFVPLEPHYNKYLFGDDTEAGYDSMYILPMLVCNQFACEYMKVTTGNSKEKYLLQFKDGNKIGDVTVTDEAFNGIKTEFRYSDKVFSDIKISEEFLREHLGREALLNHGVRYNLFSQVSEDFYVRTTFYFEDLFPYIHEKTGKTDVFEYTYVLEGKDKATHKESYIADLRIAVAFSSEKPFCESCFNRHYLENNGEFADEFFRCVLRYMDYVKLKNKIKPSKEITADDLRKHFAVFFDIKTKNCHPHWSDNRQTAVSNRMLTDIVNEISSTEIIEFFNAHEEEFINILKKYN